MPELNTTNLPAADNTANSSGAIFVTGGAGLIGSALLKQLLQKKHGPVKALYRNSLPVTLTEEETKQIEWIKGDVLDISLLNDLLKHCKKVYHTAAVVSFHPARRQQMYKINIEGTANIVNASLENKIEKLVHVSSVAALGRIRKNELVTEKTEWSEETNNSHYGKTKYLSELEVWRGIGEGLNAVIVNPTIILGEARWETGSMAIFKKAWEEFKWYTNGGTGFTDAKDVAAIMIALMQSNLSAERFIISNENLTYRDLLSKIAFAFGKKAPYKQPAGWMMEALWRAEALKAKFSKQEPLLTKETVRTSKATTRFSNEKILTALPGFAFTPIDETIARTSKWLREFYQLT